MFYMPVGPQNEYPISLCFLNRLPDRTSVASKTRLALAKGLAKANV
ncbi:hypothetical protein MNBD_ALPHA11-1972 [hydrothermal vent metagenome]|uniref:Uncharacterized protein n=1 Tax=hydrothermal vent metagenome TaxID=652676 RepID=A0A3B0U1P1_9ZZZZ